MRQSLLDHLVVDRMQRMLLHHWLHRSQTRRRIVWPMSLANGHQSGLSNQIMSLVGYCVLANLTHSALVVPFWDSHAAGGSSNKLRFDALFDEQHFLAAMARHLPFGIIGSDEATRLPAESNRTHTTRRSYIGWAVYKAIHTRLWLKRTNDSGVQAADTAFLRDMELNVYKSLRASANVRAMARSALHNALPRAGAAGRRGSYGCIHARIETDMQSSWKANNAGQPPTLARYLGDASATAVKHMKASSLASFAEVRATRHVFVSVGRDIAPTDAARLAAGATTGWGANIVRTSATTKASHNYTTISTSSSYTMDALVDMEICRGAAWFAGWPGSTFTRLLGALRGDDYFVVCPRSIARFDARNGAFVGHHEFCVL